MQEFAATFIAKLTGVPVFSFLARFLASILGVPFLAVEEPACFTVTAQFRVWGWARYYKRIKTMK